MEQDSMNQYEECIKRMSDELSAILMKNEPDILAKFKNLDADVYKILMKTGNCTMQKVSEALNLDLKKKAEKKD